MTLLWLCFCAAITGKSSAGVVPRPFTPVQVTGERVSVLGRKLALGDFLLPKQITAADQPLLSGPIQMIADPPIAAGGQSHLISNDDDSASLNWIGDSPDLHTTSRLTADCDGFCWYEIAIEPKHPVTLRSLALKIPRNAGTAKYLHTAAWNWSNTSQGLPEMGGKWAGPFLPYVWLGDEARGLAWCAESNQGAMLAHPEKALSILTQGNVVTFRAQLLDHDQVISKPITIRFGLQVTPVKPVGFAWRAKARILHDIHYSSADQGTNGKCELDTLRDGGVKTVVIHDSWTSYFGQMQPADEAKFRKLIDACHARGLRLLVYVGYGVARNAPEMKIDDRHVKWSVLPLIPWDPGYKPQTRAFDATCARSGWADWLIVGADKLFADYKLDGLYFDGTAAAWVCDNEWHGCGWRDDQGHLHPTYPILAARRLMRQMADAVHRHNPDAILDVHMSSNMTMPTLSFCDSAWNGEQFEGHTAGEKFQVPLHAFRTEFMGYAHGIDTEFLCYENRPFTFTEAIALAWVHGVEVRPYPQNLKYVTPIWRAMDRFDVPSAKWLPYWSNPPASADDADTKISAWARQRKALLAVSHLQRTAATVHVHLDMALLQLKSPVVAKDALSGKPIDVVGETFSVPFDGMNYRFVELGE